MSSFLKRRKVDDNEKNHMPSFSIMGNQKEIQRMKTAIKPGALFLISGPCGIGKTLAAHTVARELGYKVFVQYQDDDFMLDLVNLPHKSVAIFEFLEEFGEDDLPQANTHACPIICITNDAYHLPAAFKPTDVFKFYPPEASIVVHRLCKLHPQISKARMERIVSELKCDVRQIQLMLSLGVQSAVDDFSPKILPYESLRLLFKGLSPARATRVYEDEHLIASMMFDRYLDQGASIEAVANAADCISFGGNEFFTIVIPACYVRKRKKT